MVQYHLQKFTVVFKQLGAELSQSSKRKSPKTKRTQNNTHKQTLMKFSIVLMKHDSPPPPKKKITDNKMILNFETKNTVMAQTEPAMPTKHQPWQ